MIGIYLLRYLRYCPWRLLKLWLHCQSEFSYTDLCPQRKLQVQQALPHFSCLPGSITRTPIPKSVPTDTKYRTVASHFYASYCKCPHLGFFHLSQVRKVGKSSPCCYHQQSWVMVALVCLACAQLNSCQFLSTRAKTVTVHALVECENHGGRQTIKLTHK